LKTGKRISVLFSQILSEVEMNSYNTTARISSHPLRTYSCRELFERKQISSWFTQALSPVWIHCIIPKPLNRCVTDVWDYLVSSRLTFSSAIESSGLQSLSPLLLGNASESFIGSSIIKCKVREFKMAHICRRFYQHR